uniref:Uncharacterized protein n=1 Tax=Arundo donax TaxID=35708 RepID=A0A0A9FDF0_ARUDO
MELCFKMCAHAHVCFFSFLARNYSRLLFFEVVCIV